MITESTRARFAREVAKYPAEQKQSAVMACLSIVQQEQGFVSAESEAVIAEYLGMAQIAGGDAMQAVSTYKRLTSLRPTSPQPLLQLANAYAASKDSDGAANALRRALRLQPDLPAAQRALATLALANGKPQDALANPPQMQNTRTAHA